MVPVLSNVQPKYQQQQQQQTITINPLTKQFKQILDIGNTNNYSNIILPFGRWARTNGNAQEITMRLVQAIELQPSNNINIIIASPPELNHWEPSISSVIASAKLRSSEQSKHNTKTNNNTNNPNNSNGNPNHNHPNNNKLSTQMKNQTKTNDNNDDRLSFVKVMM